MPFGMLSCLLLVRFGILITNFFHPQELQVDLAVEEEDGEEEIVEEAEEEEGVVSEIEEVLEIEEEEVEAEVCPQIHFLFTNPSN
jgi:hypothetical protein